MTTTMSPGTVSHLSPTVHSFDVITRAEPTSQSKKPTSQIGAGKISPAIASSATAITSRRCWRQASATAAAKPLVTSAGWMSWRRRWRAVIRAGVGAGADCCAPAGGATSVAAPPDGAWPATAPRKAEGEPADADPAEEDPGEEGPAEGGPADGGPGDEGPVAADPADGGSGDEDRGEEGPFDPDPPEGDPEDADPVEGGLADAGPAAEGPAPAGNGAANPAGHVPAPAVPADAVPPRWLAVVPGDAASRWPAAPVPAAAGPCWPVAPGPAPTVPVAGGRALADPAGGPEGAGPACPGAVPRGAAGAAGADPDPATADGSASVPAFAGPPAGCRELPRRGRGTLRALVGCSCSGAPGFQRAEIGRLEIVISPVSGRPFSFGWLGAGGGGGAWRGWALFSPPLPDPPLSDPPRPVAARARDFHRPDRAAAASRLLCSAASLACSRSTTASGSPRSLRVLSTTAGSAVSRPPDRCSIYSRVRARSARLSSDWSLVRAATERRLR